MKKRNIFISLGLAAAMVFGVGTALVLGNKSASKEVKATDPDDRMVTVLIDMGAAAGFDGFHSPEVHYRDASYDTLNKYQMMHLLDGTVYVANLTYRSADQSINWIEFLFKQNSEDKFSTSMSINPPDYHTCRFAFNNSWAQDASDGNRYEWTLTRESDWTRPRFQYYGSGDNNIQNLFFTPDVATKSYKATFTVIETGFNPNDLGQVFFTGWGYGSFRQESVDAYMDGYSLNSFKLTNYGTYDVIICDGYEDGGIMLLKKHEGPSESYIYYVTNSASATTDYIYSWGGSEQFGSFPGTAITAVTDVEEITGNGVLHFQGGDTAKLIYKIPITKGYPVGDNMFAFNNGTQDYKSPEREIVIEKAYWWSGDVNYDATSAINFLITLEAYRNQETDDSVCNIPKGNAAFLVGFYNGLSASIRSTYIDCSTIYTWADASKESNTLVTVRKIMEQLSEIAEEPLVDAANPYSKGLGNVSNTALIIVVTASIAVISAAGAFFIIRKRKHQ